MVLFSIFFLVAELEGTSFASELLIDSAESFDFLINTVVGRVEVNLQQTRAVKANTKALADDFCGVYKIFEDSIMDGSEAAAVWALLPLDFVVTRLFGEDTTLGNDDNL